MPTVADVVDAVVAVDTHVDTFAAVVVAPSGAALAQEQFLATAAGTEELIGWALSVAPPGRVLFAVEGTRSYGIGLVRALSGHGLEVIELARPARSARRGLGKSDPIDARLGARTALALDAAALPTPRADGDREALRILLVARREMSTEKTAKTNRLIALLRSGSDTDRDLARAPLTAATLDRIARAAPAEPRPTKEPCAGLKRSAWPGP
jgi:transposase